MARVMRSDIADSELQPRQPLVPLQWNYDAKVPIEGRHFDAEAFGRPSRGYMQKRGRLPRRSGRDALISYFAIVTGGPAELEGTSENEEISHYPHAHPWSCRSGFCR
jgi:hypothetical protein